MHTATAQAQPNIALAKLAQLPTNQLDRKAFRRSVSDQKHNQKLKGS
jgi:hypothetical protein